MSQRRKAAEPVAFGRVRELCFALPGVSEKPSWGHPNFRVANRTFCTLELRERRPAVCFHLESDQVRELLQLPQFFATPYGRGQWVSRFLDGRPPWQLVRKLIDESYHRVAAPKKK